MTSGPRLLNRQLSEMVKSGDRNRRALLAGVVQADIDSLARSNRRVQVVLARLVEIGVVEVPMDDDEPIRVLIGGEES